MKVFQVWMEGYAATVDSERATYFGEYEATHFEEACGIAVNRRGKEFASYYDPINNRHWGRGFFDNEKDARKRYG